MERCRPRVPWLFSGARRVPPVHTAGGRDAVVELGERCRRPSSRPSMSTFTRKHANDLRGYGRLAADATSEVASVIESLHHTITRWPALFGVAPADTTRGITGFVYASIRAGAWLAARGLDAALTTLTPWLPAGAGPPPPGTARAGAAG